MDYDVIVIGAGVAGLTAAWRLLQLDSELKVLVLEARDRVGGRVYSVRRDKRHRDPEMGAWYIEHEARDSWSAIEELGLDTADLDGRLSLVPGMSALTEALATSSQGKVQLGSQVNEVFWRQGVVGVNYDNRGLRSAVTARRLIITLPAAVLHEGGPAITPALPPSKRAALQALKSRPGISASLIFAADSTRLKNGLPQWTQLSSSSRLRVSQSPYDGEMLLEAQFMESRAEALAGQSDGLLLNLALRAFEEALESRPALEDALFAEVLDWRTDTYSLGLGSTPGSASTHEVLAESMEDTVFFAGDSYVSPTLAGSVHGAYASGELAAAEVARSLGTPESALDPNEPVLELL